MQADPQSAMRDAIALGPDFCPPKLFAGSIDRILLGLKAHANTIAHARHVAMEDSYPRTRALIGDEAFHDAAAAHLAVDMVRARTFAKIGAGFDHHLSGAAASLARLEWAWLDVYGAAHARAFDLGRIASMEEADLALTPVRPHPAAAVVAITRGLEFDGIALHPPFVLLTRPETTVLVEVIEPVVADLFETVRTPITVGEMLEIDASATVRLISAGALSLAKEMA